jgi:hypothetical protein
MTFEAVVAADAERQHSALVTAYSVRKIVRFTMAASVSTKGDARRYHLSNRLRSESVGSSQHEFLAPDGFTLSESTQEVMH